MTATSSYFGLSSAPSYGVSNIPVHWSTIENNYINTLGLRIIAGEDFKSSGMMDPNAAIVNQRFVEAFELDSPVGMILGKRFSREGLHKSNITFGGFKIIAVNNGVKEIGIRKVLGAGISDISGLLFKEFIILVLIANAAAWPLAFFIIKKYLNNFPFRIDIGIDYFLLAGALSLLISVLTLSYNTIRSALKDPVESLRYE